MKRHIENLTVSTLNDNNICIEQDSAEDSAGVIISAEQVPLLIRWLRDAVAELNAAKPQEVSRD
jgi:hypothetical protein